MVGQIGVQAKILPNVTVLHQAVLGTTGPAQRMVLVRRATQEFIELAYHLGLAVAAREYRKRYFGNNSAWQRPTDGGFAIYSGINPQAFKAARGLYLPPVVTNLPAGGAAPRQLTEWRVKALKLCHLLRTKGYLTSQDFADAKVDMKRWKDMAWVVPRAEKEGRLTKYVMSSMPVAPLPDVGWEEVQAMILAAEKEKEALG